MIKGIIKNYNDAKFSFIQKMSQSEESIFYETQFLDDATIGCRINRLKDEYERLGSDIEMLTRYDTNDSYNKEKLKYFVKRRDDICFNIAFLASNSLNSLDSCVQILGDLDTNFKLCIKALMYYKSGDEQKTFEYFYAYFKDKNVLLEHYLINKVYGSLLYKCEQYDVAMLLLRKAVEKRPEDIEIHRILKDIYLLKNMKEEEKIEQNILEILEG